MKKLISISVVLILLSSAAFADVGAQVIAKATVLNGSTEEVDDGAKDDGTPLYTTNPNGTGFSIGRIRLSASGGLEDGTIGGALRYEAGDNASSPSAWGWAWWKPSDMIKLQIGSNPDGEFGLDGIGRWGFYQLAGDAGVVDPNKAWGGEWDWTKIDGQYGDAFFAGWGAPGVILTITPTDALAINIGIPLGNGKPAYRTYKDTTIQVKYNIDGVGTAGLTYSGDQGEEDALNDNGMVRVYFGLSSIENVGIDIGIGYQFPDSVDVGEGDAKVTNSVNNPLNIGLGISFSSDSFGVKTRVMGKLFGSKTSKGKDESLTLADDLTLLFDVLPYFVVNDTMTFYLSAGIATKTGDEYVKEYNDSGKPVIAKDESADFAWHINPYICITPSYWSAAFFAGLRIDSSPAKYQKADKDGKTEDFRSINWSIPIGIIVGF
jgi:hypothetical protein